MISTKDSILILRESRLGRIPSALFSTELMQDSGLPVVIVEYGNFKESKKMIYEPFPRMRLDGPWVRYFPQKLQAGLLLAWVLFKLVFLILASGRPRILVAHGLSEQALAFVLSKLFWVPFVIHAHEVYEDADLKGPFSRFLFKWEKWIFRAASFVIFPEAKRSEIYRERYQFKGPIFISANTPRRGTPPQPRNLRQAYQLPSDAFILGYVGGIGPSNKLELGIQALTYFPKMVFMCWGWGDKAYLEKLNALAHVLGVSERFLHLGQLSENKLETLAGCDVNYCIYEPHLLRLKHAVHASNKFFEAMAAGIPNLTSSEAGFYQFNREHKVGICAASLTVESVCTALKALMENATLRKNLGSHGRAVFEARFHYEHQFFKPLQAYQDLYSGYLDIWSFDQIYFPPQELPKAA